MNKVGNSTLSYLKDVLGLGGVRSPQQRGWGADVGEGEIGQERLPFASSKQSGTCGHQSESLDEFELTTTNQCPQEGSPVGVWLRR